MFEQIIREEDLAPDSGTNRTDQRSPEVLYVEIVPSDLVRIVVEAIRRDQLGLDQIELLMAAAAESVLRRGQRSNWTCH